MICMAQNAWLIFYPSFIGSKHLLLPDSVHHHFFKMLRSIRPHSSWLVSSFWWTFLACWLQLSTYGFGATHVRRWDSKLRSSPGGVWCVEWARGPLLGRQYTVGIVGRVLLVPYHTKYVDLTTWSNLTFDPKTCPASWISKMNFYFYNINEGVGRLILLFGYKISQDVWFNKTTPKYLGDLTWWKTGLVIETLKSTGGETGGEFGCWPTLSKGFNSWYIICTQGKDILNQQIQLWPERKI